MKVTATVKVSALREVEATLLRAAKQKKRDPARIQTYMSSKLVFVGLSVPEQRKINKVGFTFYSYSPSAIAEIWTYIFLKSAMFEAMSQALIYYGDRKTRLSEIRAWLVLSRWSRRVENWAHSDSLSSIYSGLLENDFPRVYRVLKQWNRSANPWLRRLSIVSLFYFSNSRTKQPPIALVLPMIERLIDDSDYFVQKGLGWTLRECGRAYPLDTGKFLRKHAARLKPVAFSTASEKLSKAQRAQLKALRAR